MNLMSCDGCGLVLDANKIHFDQDIYDEEGVIIDSKAEWNGNRHVPYIVCPICSKHIHDPSWAK